MGWAKEANVDIVLERRCRERRAGGERRLRLWPYGEQSARHTEQRRRVKSRYGRRVGERRAELVPADPPKALRALLDGSAEPVVFAVRRELPRHQQEDLWAKRLVIEIQAGEPSRFAVLYAHYFGHVRTRLTGLLDDQFEAEDIAQETFLRVLGKLSAYEVRPTPFESWLARVARNCALDHIARRAAVDIMAPDALASLPRADSLASDVSAWLGDGDLATFVARLPVPQRQVLLLRYGFGLTAPRIALTLDTSVENVWQLHHRAILFLRSRLVAVDRQPSAAQARLPMTRWLAPDQPNPHGRWPVELQGTRA